ncbi:MAG: di-trans,poly-cis-decaprenylcistransferase [Gemmatimonadaceae bacterium]
MKQRALCTASLSTTDAGIHVAAIMDGNGRWASARGLARSAGHAAGAQAARRVIEAAPSLGIRTLTLYAFSSDNWKRPRPEVEGLMTLFRRRLTDERERCIANGVRLTVIGRRDRLRPALLRAVAVAERDTAGGRTLHLRIALDYSARDAIHRAARRLALSRDRSREDLARLIAGEPHDSRTRDVDLLIRTGGEQRLSDFLLWEAAYAELHFTPCLWPDFSAANLQAAVADFHSRERRYGALPRAAAV